MDPIQAPLPTHPPDPAIVARRISRRAGEYATCGYWNQDTEPIVCSAGSSCASGVSHRVRGCCNSLEGCVVPITCYAQSDVKNGACDSSCQLNTFILKCTTDVNFNKCETNLWQEDTPMTGFECSAEQLYRTAYLSYTAESGSASTATNPSSSDISSSAEVVTSTSSSSSGQYSTQGSTSESSEISTADNPSSSDTSSGTEVSTSLSSSGHYLSHSTISESGRTSTETNVSSSSTSSGTETPFEYRGHKRKKVKGWIRKRFSRRHSDWRRVVDPQINPPPRADLGRSGAYLTPQGIVLNHSTRHQRQEEFNLQTFKFFDDETVPKDPLVGGISRYRRWELAFKDVNDRFIESPPEHKVKVAILDTGIDETHQDIYAHIEQIRDRYNWMEESSEQDIHKVPDSHGHGTFTAAVLLNYAPDAELFVAKISNGKAVSPLTISRAIEHAVNRWHVDVISMSFGFPTRQIDGYEMLESVIGTARSRNVLLFAAASNHGGNAGRAYPARDENVICIHSTDTNGSISSSSPNPVHNVYNIATVGEAVESAWPPQEVLSKSGTSYATPIAASMAVFLLQYARINLSDNYAEMQKQKSRMEALLTRMRIADRTRDGYQYMAINRSPDNLFGRDQAFINSRIQKILESQR